MTSPSIAPPVRASRPTELTALTGLRAIAALAVVVSHTGVPAKAPQAAHRLADWGYIGVPMFFMLSGIVLAYNYPDMSPRRGKRAVWHFYVARLARVMPLYWFMIGFCALVYASEGLHQYPGALVQSIFAVQAWSSDVLTAQSRYNGPGWSIGVELFFYALFPFLVPLVRRAHERYGARAMLTVVLTCAAGSALLCAVWVLLGWSTLPAGDGRSAHRWLYRNPCPRLLEFVAGMAIAFLVPRARTLRLGAHHLVQAAVVLYVLILAVFRSVHTSWMGAASYSALFVLPFALGMWSLSSGRGWLARFLSLRFMLTLGTASYALYLTHRWLVFLLTTGTSVKTSLTEARGWASLVLTLVIMLAVAEGAHRYIENPCRKAILKRVRRPSKSTELSVATPEAEPGRPTT